MSGLEIKRTTNTRIRVEIPRVGNRWTVEHILWMARELGPAVEAGMPVSTEIKGLNSSSNHLTADYVIVQEIP